MSQKQAFRGTEHSEHVPIAQLRSSNAPEINKDAADVWKITWSVDILTLNAAQRELLAKMKQHLVLPGDEHDHRPHLIHDVSFSRGLVQLHVEAYFEYVYPITTHGFLHKGTLLRNIDENKVPPILLKVIAISSSQCVSTTTQATSQATQWAQEVDVYVMENMGSFSTLSLQVILLWANHHHSNRKMGKAWTLLGMAARIAYYLQINVESKVGSPSEKECQRRMMWNIRILDRLLAGTVEEFTLASRFMDKLKLPCNEYFYLAELQMETDTLERFVGSTESPNIGGFAGFVGLFDIWGDILLFMRDLSSEKDTGSIKQRVSSLQQRLSDLEQRLPPNLRFVDRNLYLQASTAQKITFIMLKSWWHECHYDLFRFSLPGFRESIDLISRDADFMKHCQEKAIESALTQSIFWRSITSAKQNPISDPNVVSLVHSNTRTLLACQNLANFDLSEQTATLGEATDISDLLSSNVSFLDGLAKHFPHVAIVQQEIQRVIQQNGIKYSAEAVLNEGLPLKRRHSRQELFQDLSGIEGVEPRAEELDNNYTATAPFQRESLDAKITIGSFSLAEDNDRPIHAPIRSENADSGISSQQRQLVDSDMIHGGESMQAACVQPHHFMEESGLSNAQYQGLYEGDFTSNVPGYFSPFDFMIDDNMTTRMGYAVFENQGYSFD